jgi:hypothetical protein
MRGGRSRAGRVYSALDSRSAAAAKKIAHSKAADALIVAAGTRARTVTTTIKSAAATTLVQTRDRDPFDSSGCVLRSPSAAWRPSAFCV